MKTYGISIAILTAIGLTTFAVLPFENPVSPDEGLIYTLYIVRHAKSPDATAGQEDIDRPLEEKGIRNAIAVGKFLKQKNVILDNVVCSPSKRTYETARLISNETGYPIKMISLDSAIYRCTLETYEGIVLRTDNDHKNVMVVGHNPATTQLVNVLQKDRQIEDVPTGGIAAIQFRMAGWSEVLKSKGKLMFFYDPDDINDTTD